MGRGRGVNGKIGRRHFLQLVTGSVAWWLGGSRAIGRGRTSTTPYRVGLGRGTDPYAATLRAVVASGEWPTASMAGRVVVIKPNLVFPMAADTGVTTDPEVVRALVDLALQAGAAQVLIVEGGYEGANFSACGYDFFNSYDPRVTLVDLSQEPVALAKVPHGAVYKGMAYKRIYMPQLLLGDDVVFISAAKLKTHFHTYATLSVKNLLGLAPVRIYRELADEWRFVMHYRGISQVLVDLNAVRPVDFAVVDGVIGMEGEGPGEGTPVESGLVVAGRNALAVDRVCLWAMSLPQSGVKHLIYAGQRELGPVGTDEIEVKGDPFTPIPFAWPVGLPPLLQYPWILPARFVAQNSEEVTIVYHVASACRTQVEILRTSELSPEVTVVRTMHDLEDRPAGNQILRWDGRDDSGTVVEPGRYTVRVKTNFEDGGTDAYGSGWVWVLPPPVKTWTMS